MTEDVVLRIRAMELAIEGYPRQSENFHVVNFAKEIYGFLTEEKWHSTEVEKRPQPQEQSEPFVGVKAPVAPPPVRPFKLAALTPMQKSALKVAIDLYRTTGRVTGTDVARGLNWATPGNINFTFKRLVAMGYVRRQGWFITPIYHPDGTAVGPIVQKLPDGIARGYKPMTAKLGEVGRVVT